MKEVYKHGLYFDRMLSEAVKDIYNRIFKMNKAGLIIIDGGVGEGKTTLGVHLADYINSLHKLPMLDIKAEDQIALGGEDFVKKLKRCYQKKLPVLLYDEAGDFNKRGALTRLNALLNRTFETFRAFKVLVIIILPSFRVLDNDLFDKNIPRILIHCHSRNNNYGNFSCYEYDTMLYIKHDMSKQVIKDMSFKKYGANFRGQFKNLNEKRCKELDEVSTKGKFLMLGKAEKNFEGLVTVKEICEALALSDPYTRVLLKECGIKEARRDGLKKYFEKSAIPILKKYQSDKESIR